MGNIFSDDNITINDLDYLIGKQLIFEYHKAPKWFELSCDIEGSLCIYVEENTDFYYYMSIFDNFIFNETRIFKNGIITHFDTDTDTNAPIIVADAYFHNLTNHVCIITTTGDEYTFCGDLIRKNFKSVKCEITRTDINEWLLHKSCILTVCRNSLYINTFHCFGYFGRATLNVYINSDRSPKICQNKYNIHIDSFIKTTDGYTITDTNSNVFTIHGVLYRS